MCYITEFSSCAPINTYIKYFQNLLFIYTLFIRRKKYVSYRGKEYICLSQESKYLHAKFRRNLCSIDVKV